MSYFSEFTNTYSRRDLVLLRALGGMRVAGISSKHHGGYRTYEIDRFGKIGALSWLRPKAMVNEGLLTEKGKFKWHNDGRKERIYLYDLSDVGLALFLNIEFESGKIDENGFSFIAQLLDKQDFPFRSLSPELMLAFIERFGRLESTLLPQSIEVFREIAEEDRDEAIKFSDSVFDEVERMDKTGLSNLEITQIYDLAEKLRAEARSPTPRKQYLTAILIVLRDVFLVGTGVAATVIAYLQYLNAG